MSIKAESMEYDAVVIGAGPSGSSAARRLAEAGLKVLLVERRQEIGEPVRCAEFAPRTLKQFSSVRDIDVAQIVRGIRTFIQGELVHEMRSAGYILNRKSWEKHIAEKAVRAGARVVTGIQAIDAVPGRVTLQNGAGHVAVTASYILGCDGPRSLIRRALGNNMAESCVAMQVEAALTEPLEYAHIYFDSAYYDGYAWVFPKGQVANVGLAVNASLTGILKNLLRDFCQKLIAEGIVRDETTGSEVCGLIPSEGLATHLASGGMLVAGDAAGCTHPITGAGILYAVVSGKMAADSIIDEQMGGELMDRSYPIRLKSEYNEAFIRARNRFLLRHKEWTMDREKFDGVIRRTWPAFPEYYRT